MGVRFNFRYCIFIFVLISCERNRHHDFQKDITTNTKVVRVSQSTTKKKSLKAKVIRIVDGDTLEILLDKEPMKIRLAHIDCPEKRGKQPYGNAAKQALSDLCFGQIVKAEWSSKDRYGRYIAVIYNKSGQNVNQEMVRLGMAWHYKQYSTDPIYSELEAKARKNKIGLWQDPNPVAPWDWRR